MKRIITVLVLLTCLLGLGMSTVYSQGNRRHERQERIRSCNAEYRAALARAKSLRGRARSAAKNEARIAHDRCLRDARR